MTKLVLTFLNLASPILLAVFYIILVLTVAPTEIQINVPLVGSFIALQHTITNPRPFLLVVGLGFFTLPAIRNYHKLFPEHVKMQVFYDASGIEATLQRFSELERRKLNIEEDWQNMKYHQLYLDKLEAILRRFRLPTHIEFNESTHAQGDVTIRIRRIRGLQKYQFEDVKGSLRFTFVNTKGDSSVITDDFELLPNKANIISASLKDLYIHWTIIMQPRFNHYVHVSPTRRFHVKDLELIAITKLRFFPFIDCDRTLYCVEDTYLLNRQSNKPKLIPVGYAINDYD